MSQMVIPAPPANFVIPAPPAIQPDRLEEVSPPQAAPDVAAATPPLVTPVPLDAANCPDKALVAAARAAAGRAPDGLLVDLPELPALAQRRHGARDVQAAGPRAALFLLDRAWVPSHRRRFCRVPALVAAFLILNILAFHGVLNSTLLYLGVIALWLHTVAFVIAWGYYGILGRMVLPALQKRLGVLERASTLELQEKGR